MCPLIPKKLHKYRSFNEYTESIFSQQELYFAAPDELNDPFECEFTILCTGKQNQQILNAGALQTVLEKCPDLSPGDALDAAKQVGEILASHRLQDTSGIFYRKLAADTNRQSGILCLSERNSDIKMWSHYADSHRGICIEFDTSVASSFFLKAQQIVYSDDFSRLNLYDVVTNEQLRKSAPWMLAKSKQWEHEQEWRILDFNAGPGAQRFPAKCLSGVTLGYRISTANKEKVMQWVSTLPHTVAIHQAEKCDGDFCLNLSQIS